VVVHVYVSEDVEKYWYIPGKC